MHLSSALKQKSDGRCSIGFKRFAIVVSLLTIILPLSASAEPWRLSKAADLPGWLNISGSHRTRYESLDNQYRAGRRGGDQSVALRTMLLTELRFDGWRVGAELIDSRHYLDDSGTPLNTTHVNPAELLQAYLAWDAKDLIESGSTSELKLGRLTIDFGSRRFVARSKFRNTMNTFTGANWIWNGADGNRIHAFYTLPVNRKPNTAVRLEDNDIEFDEEDTDVRYWGLYYQFRPLAGNHRAEIYIIGLDESDSENRPTRNREHFTPGLRFYRPKVRGEFDYLLEAAIQFGEVRATSRNSDTRDLDHFAHFEHLEIGYTFEHPWSPRLNLDFDYASGDDSPTDSESERFDTMFGARRFEFGPTGIYGAFARSNLLTPGLRLNFKPMPRSSVMLAYRGYWLASDQDAWTTAGTRDASGNSGSFIGQQIEGRFRYDVAPGNYRFEAGLVGLFDGEFMRKAPNASRQGDVFYAYTQILLTF